MPVPRSTVTELFSSELWLVGPVAAFLLAAVLTFVVRHVAPRIGLVDHPDGGRKAHRRPTPLMGGVAVLAAFIVVSGLSLLTVPAGELSQQVTASWGWLITSAVMFCAVGVVDDRVGLRPRYKFLLQILSSLPFAVFGHPVSMLNVLGHSVELGVLAVPFTVFWLVACSNIVNLIDGLDGLASMVGSVSCITIAVLSTMHGTPSVAYMAVLFSACIMGFLVHNWPPAKIFLGDAGSMTIGYAVGAFAIDASVKTAAGFALAIPVVLLAVPIFDTAMAIVRRKLQGRGIGDADRAHFHHRLQDRGLTRTQTLLAMSALCVTMAGVAVFSQVLRSDVVAVAACLAILVAVVASRLFGHHETHLALRHVEAFSEMLADSSRLLRDRIQLVRVDAAESPQERSFGRRWDEMCEHVRQLGGRNVAFELYDPSGEQTLNSRDWSADEHLQDGVTWEIALSIPRDDGSEANIRAAGTSPAAAPARRLASLLMFLEHFGRRWGIETAEQPAASPLRIPQPHVVTPEMAASLATASSDSEVRRAA
ncbi:WecA-like glycosyltransferase [Maioricimonas rarisocia]|uniref:WecA-like glycosyltransferase n=1 Tax=Maioricimonas rarisocia TaxID=2528026 RepID=A0A517ZCA3_9PLAN|nr:MraY family glycosyltransferase [Maioricimonas rarisocia]QDU40081.1 WecA-like glycosyltransferase [Maioricimonas rarisocia]